MAEGGGEREMVRKTVCRMMSSLRQQQSPSFE
jgi:hypothetical protein